MTVFGYTVDDARAVEIRRRPDGTAGVYVDGERVRNVTRVVCDLGVDRVLEVSITFHARDFRIVSEGV